MGLDFIRAIVAAQLIFVRAASGMPGSCHFSCSNMTTVDPQRTRALLMLVLATACWGLSFPVIKTVLLLHDQLLGESATWFSTFYTIAPRFLLATGIIAIWIGRGFWRVTAGERKQGVIMGLFAAAGMLFQNDGLQYTEASTSAFLTQLYAILIPVWLALRARRNPGARVWLCSALVLAGVAILGRFNWRELHLGRGEWETLLASVFFMGQILWLEKKEFAANRPLQLTLVMFAVQTLIFWVGALVSAPNVTALIAPWSSGPWLGLTLMLTVVCTVGAYYLMNTWQPKITAIEAGLIYCVEPIFGTVMAWYLPALFSVWAAINYPNESATWTLFIGGGLITAANILIQFKPPEKTQ